MTRDSDAPSENSEPLEDMVQRQARLRAQAEVDAVTHTMALEDRVPEPDVINAQVEELAERFVTAS